MRVLQPILFAYDPQPASTWVDAAPFRAHVDQLLTIGLTEPVIAQLTGMSVRAVRHLVFGRHGRPIRRICGESARRLLLITTRDATAMRFRPVAVRPSRLRLRAMAAAGWSPAQLAETADISLSEVQQVLERGSATCSRLLELKIAAAFTQWDADQEFPSLYAAVA